MLVGVWLGDLGGCPGCVLGWGVWILWSAGWVGRADYLVEYIWWMWLTCCGVVLYCVECESLGVHNIDWMCNE